MENTFTKAEKVAFVLSAIAIVACGVLMYLMASGQDTQHAFGDAAASTLIPTMPVDTSIQVGPQNSVQVLATSTARIFASITATSTAYCNESDAAPTASAGAASLGLGQPLEIGPTNLYTGAIRCMAPASTTLGVVASQ